MYVFAVVLFESTLHCILMDMIIPGFRIIAAAGHAMLSMHVRRHDTCMAVHGMNVPALPLSANAHPASNHSHPIHDVTYGQLDARQLVVEIARTQESAVVYSRSIQPLIMPQPCVKSRGSLALHRRTSQALRCSTQLAADAFSTLPSSCHLVPVGICPTRRQTIQGSRPFRRMRGFYMMVPLSFRRMRGYMMVHLSLGGGWPVSTSGPPPCCWRPLPPDRRDHRPGACPCPCCWPPPPLPCCCCRCCC